MSCQIIDRKKQPEEVCKLAGLCMKLHDKALRGRTSFTKKRAA